MNIKTSPSHITRCILILIYDLVTSGDTSTVMVSLGHCQTSGLKEEKWKKSENVSNMMRDWQEQEKEKALFGCEKTWQGLKEVQKAKEWYRKHFWECLHCLYHYRILLDENEKVRNMVKKIFFIPHHVIEVTNIKTCRLKLYFQKHSQVITKYVEQ